MFVHSPQIGSTSIFRHDAPHFATLCVSLNSLRSASLHSFVIQEHES
nr:MAG TPA: hypothetical protein [Caudoviricetes sp.]